MLQARTLIAICLAVVAVHRQEAIAEREQAADVLVFAAASLQTVLDELAAPAQKATGARMRMSYAASSALARQVENGAPADLFISADLDWMNYLADRRLIRSESRVDLLGNQLVLIASKARPINLKIAPSSLQDAGSGSPRAGGSSGGAGRQVRT
jgi:molybdate transport system substrate-binding protein